MRDSNGAVLANGDSVSVIKDLKIKSILRNKSIYFQILSIFPTLGSPIQLLGQTLLYYKNHLHITDLIDNTD